MYTEKNTGTNLPAQIEIYATPGGEYHFLFIAKGGGSANKSYLFQQTKALLNPDTLLKFIGEKIKVYSKCFCFSLWYWCILSVKILNSFKRYLTKIELFIFIQSKQLLILIYHVPQKTIRLQHNKTLNNMRSLRETNLLRVLSFKSNFAVFRIINFQRHNFSCFDMLFGLDAVEFFTCL